MTYLKATLAACTAVALSACGGATTSSTAASVFSASDEAARTFAADGDFGTIIQTGTVRSRAGTASGITLRFGGGTTELVDATVAVTRNANGEFTATLNGETHAFEKSHRHIESDGTTTYGYDFKRSDGTTFSLFSASGTLDELLAANNGHSVVVQVAGDLQDGTGTLYHRAYAAIGGETPDATLAARTGSATYNGYGRMDIYPTTNFVNSGTSRSRLRGDSTITANFSTGEVSGNLNNLTLQAPGSSTRTATAGQVNFGTATFKQNTFSGNVTSDAALTSAGLALNSTSSYTGAFFGPNAEEVSAVVSATGTLNGTAVNASGYFTQ